MDLIAVTERREMQHFQHLEDDVREQLFLHAPRSFADSDERDLLAIALGATLYVPATRAGLADIVSKRASEGVSSMVLDLEDAVADHEVESARANAVEALDKIASTDAVGMLLFVRVREVADIHKVAASLTEGRAALTGFVIPKFGSESGPVFLDGRRGRIRTAG